MKKNKLIMIIFLVLSITSNISLAEAVNEADIVVCQDQAENYGNGKGDDIIGTNCLASFKRLAVKKSIVEATNLKMKFFGYKNMILIEKVKNNLVSTEIVAGNSTELKSIKAVAVDEKNQEVIVLEESGDVLFFTTTLTGNIAPYRILKHKNLQGASELAIDNVNDQIIVYNKKSEKIYFFSRLANVNAPKEKQKLKILATINTSSLNFSDMSLDINKNEITGVDLNLNQKVTFPLTKNQK